MSLAGLGVVAIWHDLLPEATQDFHEWHNREHMPERVGIPGFVRGRRYLATRGAPTYFNLYEAQSVEVLGGQDYLNRLNAPTPWTQRVVPSFRNVARSICRVLWTQGVGQGGDMLTLCFDVAAGHEARWIEALQQRLLPSLIHRPQIAAAHLCVADDAISRVETNEKKARADGTRVPRWVLMVEGGSAAAVEAAGQVLEAALRADTAVSEIDSASYRLEHTRCKLPWSAG